MLSHCASNQEESFTFLESTMMIFFSLEKHTVWLNIIWTLCGIRLNLIELHFLKLKNVLEVAAQSIIIKLDQFRQNVKNIATVVY